MKLAILKESKKREKTIYLDLKEEDYGITVIACNEEGIIHDGGNIIRFNNNGGFVRIPNIDRDLGFDLDDSGKIKE